MAAAAGGGMAADVTAVRYPMTIATAAGVRAENPVTEEIPVLEIRTEGITAGARTGAAARRFPLSARAVTVDVGRTTERTMAPV